MTTIKTINNTAGTTTAIIIIVPSESSSLDTLPGAVDLCVFAMVVFGLIEGVVWSIFTVEIMSGGF